MAIYNSKLVDVVVNNVPITGFAETVVKITPMEKEKIKTEAGARGDFVHSQNHDERHKIELTLQHNSPSNKVLSDLLNGNVSFDVFVKNSSDGAYLGQSSSCVINERIELEYGKTAKPIKWTLIAGKWNYSFV